MDPIRNIIKVRVNNQDYLYQYENAWDKEKQRSYSKHRITVGKLVDGKVQLGRKFLTNNPQYKDIEFKFEDHKLIAASDKTPTSPSSKMCSTDFSKLNPC